MRGGATSQVSGAREKETDKDSRTPTGTESPGESSGWGPLPAAARGRSALTGLGPGLGAEGTEGLALLRDAPVHGEDCKGSPRAAVEKNLEPPRGRLFGERRSPREKRAGSGSSRKAKRPVLREATSSSSPPRLDRERLTVLIVQAQRDPGIGGPARELGCGQGLQGNQLSMWQTPSFLHQVLFSPTLCQALL